MNLLIKKRAHTSPLLLKPTFDVFHNYFVNLSHEQISTTTKWRHTDTEVLHQVVLLKPKCNFQKTDFTVILFENWKEDELTLLNVFIIFWDFVLAFRILEINLFCSS